MRVRRAGERSPLAAGLPLLAVAALSLNGACGRCLAGSDIGPHAAAPSASREVFAAPVAAGGDAVPVAAPAALQASRERVAEDGEETRTASREAPDGTAASDASPDGTTSIEPEYVEVTATRIEEDSLEVPASMTIITGEDMWNRGARTLRDALALATGVSVAPGGDGGPASSVVALWGLQEFDAFLLVVDGVPWGGAFNPAVATLDLVDVERIEILRGPAPVIYGATSFVGVIQVIRRPAGAAGDLAAASAGNHTSGSIGGRAALPRWGALESSITGDLEQQGYEDPDAAWQRAHFLYRGSLELGGGRMRIDLDLTSVRQQPSSPVPRVGEELSPLVPLDANYNPGGAYVNQQQIFLALGHDVTLASADWSTTLSGTTNSQSALRGFLVDVSNTDPNAHGFRASLDTDNLYFDTHFAFTKIRNARIILGLQNIYGRGSASGGDFDYFAPLAGKEAAPGSEFPSQAHVEIRDTRSFWGLYGQLEGVEGEVEWFITKALVWKTSLAYHNDHFTDHVTDFDGVPTDLDGNRLEMSPRILGATGVTYAPAKGWTGTATATYVGSQYLNKRNTALQGDYWTWSAGVGYRGGNLEVRLDGTNINDQRPAISESELGDAQYYLLPARQVRLTGLYAF